MSTRGRTHLWGWVLIALAVVALCWAGLEWWYQANGQQILDPFVPGGANTTPIDWDQARKQSLVRMAVALIGAIAMGVGGVVLLKRRKTQTAPVS